MRCSTDLPEPGSAHTERKREQGQVLVEYGLILLLIVLVAIPVLGLVWPPLQPHLEQAIHYLGV
jgi:Flp pilus assembly pilin Flp